MKFINTYYVQILLLSNHLYQYKYISISCAIVIDVLMPSQRHTAPSVMSPTLRPRSGKSRAIGQGRASPSEKHAGELRGKKCPPSRRDRHAKIAGHEGARSGRGDATEIQETNGSRLPEKPPTCPAEASGTRGRLTSNRDRASTGEKGGDACSLVITEKKQKTRRKA